MTAPILLLGTFDAEASARWTEALQAALPDDALWCPDPATPPESIADQLAQTEIAIVASPPPGWLTRCPKLGLIQSLWAGVDRLLNDPTLPAAPVLSRMVDPAMSTAMAETAHWAVLGLHRHYFDYALQQQTRHWHPLPQRRADEVRVTVLGLGQMGRTTALRLRAAGYRVRGWQRQGPSPSGVDVTRGRDALPHLLADTDIVVNLLPLTSDTTGLLDRAFFAHLPRGASLINLARGAHVIEADLLEALNTGALHRAVLDVFATEPLPKPHPLWIHPQVTVLPHAAALTDERSAAHIAAAHIQLWRAGQPVPHRVDRGRGY